MTWGFLIFCVGAAFPTALIVSFWAYLAPGPGLWIGDAVAALSDVGPFGLLIFALRFPLDSPTGWRRNFDTVVPVLAVVVTATDFVASRLAWMGRLDYQVLYLDLIDLIAWLLIVGCLVDTYRHSAPSDKQRLKWALWGVAIGFLAILGNYAIADILPKTPADTLLARFVGMAAVVMPLAVGYAILKYRVIDVSLVLNRAASYIAATTIVAGGFAVIFWSVSRAMMASHFAMIAQLGMMVLFGILFLRSYGGVQNLITTVISKPWRLRTERARFAISVLPHAPSLEAMDKILITDIGAALELEAAAVLRCSVELPEVGTSYGWDRSALQSFMSDPAFVAYVSGDAETVTRTARYWSVRTEAGNEAPAFVVPISLHGKVHAVLMYGGHRSGAALDRADVEILYEAAAGAARAYAAIFDRSETIRRLSVLFDPMSRPEHLQGYIAEYILGSLAPRTQDALIACCSLPDATLEEIIVATGNPQSSSDLAQLAMIAPFLRRSPTGVYTVPESFALTICERFKLRAHEFNIRCARQCLENQLFERASTFFAVAADNNSALATLEMLFERNLVNGIFHVTARQKELLKSALPSALHPYPMLWLAQALERYASEDPGLLRSETVEIAAERKTLPPSGQLLLADWAIFLSQAAGHVRAMQLSFLGMSVENAPYFAVLRALIEMRMQLSKGEIRAATSCANDAAELAHNLGSSLEAVACADAHFAAWLCGDQESEQRHAGRLQETRLGGFPRYLAMDSLMDACQKKTVTLARHHANIALNYATAAGDGFLEIITRLVLGAYGGGDSEAHLRRALERADSLGAGALTEGVEAIISGEAQTGAFKDLFLRRIPAQMRAAADAPIAVHIAGALVTRGGEPVALSVRERAVVIALSRYTRPCGATELTDLLWPEYDEAPATKALQVCIHRVRAKLGDADAILSLQQGYKLRDDIDVDLPRIEAFLRGTRVPLDHCSRLRLSCFARELAEAPLVDGAAWEWYVPLGARAATLAQTVLQFLAKDALDGSDPGLALQYSAQMIAFDACDEAANELCILSHIKLGDMAAAQRHFRQYRELLASELHAEPARHLHDLIRSIPARGSAR